jgi:23S rRNA pseudouridine1911/1915/1917 synthase
MIFSSEVPFSVKKGTPVIDYLTERFTYYKRNEWLLRLAEGKVTRNGALVQVSDTVMPREVISYDAGEFEEPAADLNYRIIYEDEWLLGIDKPGNLLVHRAGRSFRNNLIYQLRFIHNPAYPDSHAIHRLDRETSGVVLVAKNAMAQAVFGKMLAAGSIAKVYRAMVSGSPLPQEIALPIGKKDPSPRSCTFCVDPSGKPAVTRIIASQPMGNGMSMLTIEPLTGRTHQIRVHCAAIGAAIVGDKRYGMTEAQYRAWLATPERYGSNCPIKRQALHCASLSFVHPFTKDRCKIEAPLPEDMRRIAECGM